MVGNEWSYVSVLPIRLHDADVGNFTFTFTFSWSVPANTVTGKKLDYVKWNRIIILWSIVLPMKLTGFQLIKKFLEFYRTRMFITVFTTARHLLLS
jgi:hypothetical protein